MDKLIKQRGTQKAALTRLENYVATLKTTKHTVADLRVRIEQINAIWASFGSLQDEIEDICDPITQLPEQQNERGDIESRYFVIRAALETQMSQITTAADSNATPQEKQERM